MTYDFKERSVQARSKSLRRSENMGEVFAGSRVATNRATSAAGGKWSVFRAGPPGTPDRPGGGGGGSPQTGTITRTRPRTQRPSMYKVLILNDDYTPMEFVVHVLERFFNKNAEEATEIMLHVHRKGVGICGVYPYEIAETKVNHVVDFARKNEHPLQCTLEKE